MNRTEQFRRTVIAEVADLFSPVGRFWSGECLREHCRIMSVAAVLLTGATAAAIGAIHARLYGHDIFFLLDNGWRTLHGQRVHVDYSSAWGPLTFLLIAAGLAVSGGSVAAVTYASAFFAVVTGAWSAWLAAGRSRSMTGIVFPCFIALLAAAPFALGDPPLWTSHGMVYNRYGYALLGVIMLECFLPADESHSRRRRLSESILTGCAVAILLFLKVTYFLVALPLLGTSLLLWKPRRDRALAYAAGFGATAIVFLAYLRFNVVAMANDLLAAAAARSGSLGVRHEFTPLFIGVVCHLVPLAILAFGCARLSTTPEGSAPPLWRTLRYPLAAFVVVAADGLLLITNAQLPSYPLTAAFALVLLVSIDNALCSSVPMSSTRKFASLFVLLAGFLFVPLLLQQAAGLVYGFVEARINPNPPGLLRFESPRLRALVLYDTAPDDIDRYSNGREYVASVNDGMRLLVANTRPSDKVATLDMFNPFAYALDREPIRGGIAAAAYRYTLDDRNHPSPDRFLGDAAVVMVPKYPAAPPIFYDGYRNIYQPAIEREFHLETESSRWRLYRRVTQQSASSVPDSRYTGVN